jgi:hypothetical protein
MRVRGSFSAELGENITVDELEIYHVKRSFEIDLLEKILERSPGSVPAPTRLSKIYERAGDWDKCKAVLERAIQVSPAPSGRDGADLFFRLGEVAQAGDSDVDTSILHFQQALRHDGGHQGARSSARFGSPCGWATERISTPAGRLVTAGSEAWAATSPTILRGGSSTSWATWRVHRCGTRANTTRDARRRGSRHTAGPGRHRAVAGSPAGPTP